MRWLVEILDIKDNENIIRDALEKAGYKLIEKQNNNAIKLFINHPKYEQFDNSHLVYQDVQKISETIQRFFLLESENQTLRISFGAIHEICPNGSVTKHLSLNLVLPPLNVLLEVQISDETPHNQILNSSQTFSNEKRNKKISHLGAALVNQQVLEIIELLNIDDPSTTELGHIVDIVQDACEGDLTNVASVKAITRFRRSINHPKVMGLKARHAISKEQPPPNPMSFEEACLFAKSIGRAWLKKIEQEF